MPSIASITQAGGEYTITVALDNETTIALAYPAGHPDDHTPESWVATCCREALLLAAARTEAAADQPVHVPIPPEFAAKGSGVQAARRA